MEQYIISIVKIITNCVLTQLLAIIGSCCNSLTILVLSKNGLKDTNDILLLSLAVCDLLYLLTLAVRKLGCILSFVDMKVSIVYDTYTSLYILVFCRMLMLLSTSHIVLIAIERSFAVYFPFAVKRILTRKTVIGTISVLYLSWCVIIGPFYFTISLAYSFSDEFNSTIPTFANSKFFEDNQEGLEIFNQIILSVLRGPIFYTIVVGCSAAISYELFQITKRRSLMTSSNTAVDVKISRMLLVLCILYIGLSLPSLILFLCGWLVPDLDSTLFYFLLDIEEVFFAINANVNFFTYILMSRKFYNTFVVMFGCSNKLRSDTTIALRSTAVSKLSNTLDYKTKGD